MFSSTVIALITLLPALTLADTCARKYTVKLGDDCDSISAAQNSSTWQLAAVNAGNINADCTNLGIGQEVCLGTVGSDCQATYVVKLGDVCNDIMNKFSLNSTIFYHNNPQIDDECHNIYDGEVLCVESKVNVPPASSSGPVPINVHPAPAPATTKAAPAAATPTPPPDVSSGDDDSEDDGDDDNLPFCD